MAEQLPERLARVEEHITTQNGLLTEIRNEQRQTREELHSLARSLSYFKGLWSGVTILFGAVVAWATTHFGGKS